MDKSHIVAKVALDLIIAASLVLVALVLMVVFNEGKTPMLMFVTASYMVWSAYIGGVALSNKSSDNKG